MTVVGATANVQGSGAGGGVVGGGVAGGGVAGGGVDGGGGDGTEERAAADFIDAGDEGGSLGAGGSLVAVAADEGAEHALLAGGRGDGFGRRLGSHLESLVQESGIC